MGGNEGQTFSYLRSAIELIGKKLGPVTAVSSYYTTKAWGPVPQPDFINIVISINTVFPPLYCLKIVLDIEKSFGRKRTIKYGPRTLDIDIIYYGKVTLKHPDLILPHPEMSKRKFVLVPLCEISASFVHPELKKSNQELLELCSDDLEVKRYQQ